MLKIGLLVGRENTFPPAFIEHVNGRDAGVVAEYCHLGGTRLGDPSGYAVIVDRISHEIPYYRSYLKQAALEGAVIVNDPFWHPADDKFFGSALAARIGVAVPRTVALPNRSYIEGVSTESLRNLTYPLAWQELCDYVGLPAFLKPSVGGGWKNVYKVHSLHELIASYDQTGELPMILQENIQFEKYVRCICFGGEHIRPMRYEPGAPFLERYQGLADEDYLGADLHARVIADARWLNRALGYTMNTVEFAVRDGIPYAIDFLNPACDLDSFSIGQEAFDWSLRILGDMVIDFAINGAKPAHSYGWQQTLSPVEPPVVPTPGEPSPTPAPARKRAAKSTATGDAVTPRARAPRAKKVDGQ